MVIDTSAIFAILLSESERLEFIKILAGYRANIRISASTLVEAHVVAQRIGEEKLEQDLGALVEEYGVETIAVNRETAQIAIDAHRRYGRGSGHPAKLNFGDCFAYALAKQSGEPLLFKGNDFSQTDIESAL